MAAILNFVGALLGVGVAKTIKDILTGFDGLTPNHALTVVLSALVGAIVWNLITWYFGIPSSSSHALIGGLIGVGLAAGVIGRLGQGRRQGRHPDGAQPRDGLLRRVPRHARDHVDLPARPTRTRSTAASASSQTVSAAALSLGHGLQDAQKTMGVIVLALIAGGEHTGDDIPLWVILAAAGAISLGTMSGGMRIMRTMGRRIIALDPPRGFAAESTAAVVLYGMAIGLHAPVSTTHTMTSAVMGAGATKRFSAVRWGVARSIITAWVITIPAAAAVGALCLLPAALRHPRQLTVDVEARGVDRGFDRPDGSRVTLNLLRAFAERRPQPNRPWM